MAINKTINKRTNTHGAMRNCIEYVLRQDKTSELLTYVTGPYCHDEINYDLVYRTFLEEKKMWDKDSGRMYAHNIISWHKDEQITPEQALEFGKEFAENWFSGFQTLMAVHKDKDHIHCHLVTNSVSYEDGRKLHNTKKDLERMKQLTNQMCRERGLTVVEKGKHFDGSQIEKGEVIAWSKDKYNLFRQQVKDSFVADCAMAILKALENCISKEKFIEKMKQFGWSVNWIEKRKHITFQNQDGKKVRDSNLSKTFHLDISKEGLENEFDRNRQKARDSVNRDSRSDEELAGYYRQVEAACEGADGVTGASDGRERRVTGEKSEDERVYPEISGKDTQAENGKTEVILRELRNARRNSEVKRRNSSFDNRNVRNAEVESIASAEQRRFEEQKRLEEQERARAARRRNKRRSGPEL
ncbi:relaxase/mobilization nuclease domain-containing protein [Blautia faecicola]|nr:relaxase/mobilization nuclease domain-containing protein [Blautia faecicola]